MATAGNIIPVNTAASGLDIFLRFQGILTDPLSISYVITEPAGSDVGSGTGFKRSTGHYDARNTVIPSGFSETLPWKITWTYTSPAGITNTSCENFCVVAGLTGSFSNIQNIIDMVKLDLALEDDAFTEQQYKIFTQKAINKVNRCICLTGTSDELSFNEGTGLISPALTSSQFDLVVMAMECLIFKRDNKIAIGKGIRVKDGETEIDTTASFGGFAGLLGSICDEFNEACKMIVDKQKEDDYKNAATCGAEVIWYGNTRVRERLDHDGQGTVERTMLSPFEHPDGLHGGCC